ncbi:MAG: hypothetical protein H8E60_06460 [Candidatus Marinimicrobia bacterium]|nr:hypothetical protein [Candidatus Neomarinimicrobiota bacterium]
MVFAKVEFNPGLLFTGRVNDRPRTQLNLSPNKPLKLNDEFTLSFETSFQDYWTFGYILNLTTENGYQLSLTNQSWDNEDSVSFHLIENHEKKLITLKVAETELIPQKWQSFSISISKKKNQIQFSIDDNRMIVKSTLLPQNNEFNLIFGRDHKMGDVCHVAIRNINISSNEDVLHQWLLNETDGEIVKNSMKSTYSGKQFGGEWQIGKHLDWSKFKSIQSHEIFMTIPEKSGGSFLLINQEKIIHWDYKTGNQTLYSNIMHEPYEELKYFFNIKDSILYRQYRGRSNISTYNFNNESWSTFDTLSINRHYYGFSQFEDNDHHFYISGGYGYFKIKGHIQTYNFKKNYWDTLNIKINEPYYRNSIINMSGFINDNLYLAGGRGNKSGMQEFGYFSYYDLWKLDISNLEMIKIWEDSTLSDSLDIYKLQMSRDEKTAYIIFKELTPSGKNINILSKLYVEQGELEEILKFPVYPNENIIFNEMNQQLVHYYTVVDSSNSTTQFNYSTLNWPPINKLIYENKNSIALQIFWFLFILIIGIGTFILYKHKCKKKIFKIISSNNRGKHQLIQNTPCYIQLFDEMNIYCNGNEIGHQRGFTLQNKRFLAYLIIKGYKSNSGISIEQFGNDFWEIDDVNSITNRRTTLFSRVRNLFNKLPELPYIVIEGKVYFNWENDNYSCDLKIIWEVIKKIDDHKKLDSNQITQYKLVSELLGNSNLLPDLNDKWAIDEKELLKNLIYRFFIKLGELYILKKDSEALCELGMRMLNINEFDIDAVKFLSTGYELKKQFTKSATLKTEFNQKYIDEFGNKPVI